MRAWQVVLMTALAAAGCPKASPELATGGLSASSSSGGPMQVDPVTVSLSHTRAAVLESADGVVRVLVPALAVSAPMDLTLSRVRADLGPQPREGDAYVLTLPAGGQLLAPARVEWAVLPSVSVPVSELRVSTLPTQGVMAPLPGAQAGLDVVSADVTGPGVLVLVDRRTLGGAAWSPDTRPASAGDSLLWRADVVGARAAYNAARSRGPDPHAALGRAVSDLILLTRQAPLSDALLRCGLSQDAVLNGLLAEGGVFAQAAADRAGDALFTATRDGVASTLLADEVYTRRRGRDVEVVAAGPGFELRVMLPPEGAMPGSPMDRRGFVDGRVRLTLGTETFAWEEHSNGSIVFRRGNGVGGVVTASLNAVVLTGTAASVTLTGNLADAISRTPLLLENLGVLATEMPRADGIWEQVLSQCGPDVTGAWLRRAGQSLAERLAAIQVDLLEAAESGETQALIVLPQGLTRLPRGTPLTARDARVIRGLVGVARAVLLAAANFRALGDAPDGGTVALEELVVEGTRSVRDADGGVVEVPALVADLPRISSGLNENLFRPAVAPLALHPAREVLTEAAQDLRTAALDTESAAGWVIPGALDPAAALKLALFFNAFIQSLPAQSAPVPLAEAGVSVQAGHFFDEPPTHQALLAGNGGDPFTRVFEGNAQALSPRGRRPELLWMDHGFSTTLWESVVVAPPALAQACTGTADLSCGPGWSCAAEELGTCDASGVSCLTDESCVVPYEPCTFPFRCRRGLPESVPWEAIKASFLKPHAAGMADWQWHLWQPLVGRDPADVLLVP